MRHIEFNLPDFELVMEAFSSMSIVPPSSLKERKKGYVMFQNQ